ncbi:hypothetical protein C8J57DRAFT_1268663 [Mycena rebaudengoi]|nr:hypothetical protein C8J57DRAFT_1268663 [Mycena rebaudengoi]
MASQQQNVQLGIDAAKCVLVIGATSGIGRALALSISELPSNPVVVCAGRRQDRLKELKETKKLETYQIDVAADQDTLKKNVDEIVAKFPNLDAIIFSSGIQYQLDFKATVDLDQVAREIQINYLSVVSLISLFLPHLLKLGAEGRPTFIIPITSALGLMPAPPVINYCASKAALRSFTTSLRIQMKGTNVNVIEIIPPLVESELHDEQGTSEQLSKIWMPLDEYTKKTMDGLRKGDTHVPVGMAETVFKRFSELDKPRF